MVACTLIELKAVSKVFSHSMAQNSEPYGHYKDRARMCSLLKLERRLQQLGFSEWFNEQAKPLSFHFRFVHTCRGTQLDTSSPTRARILDHWRHYLGHRNLQSTARYAALAL
jgi:hypothetical protein